MAKLSDKFLRAHHKAWDLTDKLNQTRGDAKAWAKAIAPETQGTKESYAGMLQAAAKAHLRAGAAASLEGEHDIGITHALLSHDLAKYHHDPGDVPTSAAIASRRLPERPATTLALKASNLASRVQENLKARAEALAPAKEARAFASNKPADIVDVAADAAAKAYSASYKDALSKGADEKTARTTAYQARQEAHKQAITGALKGTAPEGAHADRLAKLHEELTKSVGPDVARAAVERVKAWQRGEPSVTAEEGKARLGLAHPAGGSQIKDPTPSELAAHKPDPERAMLHASHAARIAAGGKPALAASKFSPETQAKLSEIQGRIADLKAKTEAVKAGATTTREQHAERLKAFVEKAKAPHPLEKRVAEMQQKLEQTRAQTRKIDQGIARKERAEDHGPLQSGLKGGKFYVTRSGAKKYIK